VAVFHYTGAVSTEKNNPCVNSCKVVTTGIAAAAPCRQPFARGGNSLPRAAAKY
jgi:hypothetical protein